MRFIALAFAAATFIGASCPNPVTPPPDVVTDSGVDSTAPPVCRCKPCPAPDASCPVADAAPPAVDAAPMPPPKPSCQTACDNAKRLGCREGSQTDCAKVLCAINSDPRFVHYDVACLTNASSPAGIVACGATCTK